MGTQSESEKVENENDVSEKSEDEKVYYTSLFFSNLP